MKLDTLCFNEEKATKNEISIEARGRLKVQENCIIKNNKLIFMMGKNLNRTYNTTDTFTGPVEDKHIFLNLTSLTYKDLKRSPPELERITHRSLDSTWLNIGAFGLLIGLVIYFVIRKCNKNRQDELYLPPPYYREEQPYHQRMVIPLSASI